MQNNYYPWPNGENNLHYKELGTRIINMGFLQHVLHYLKITECTGGNHNAIYTFLIKTLNEYNIIN